MIIPGYTFSENIIIPKKNSNFNANFYILNHWIPIGYLFLFFLRWELLMKI